MADYGFLNPILQNPVVTGLSFTAVIGAAAYQLRQIPHWIETALYRATIVKLWVDNRDPAFIWLERWMAKQPYALRAKNMQLRWYDTEGAFARSGNNEVSWNLSPGPGLHWFWWHKKLIWIDRQTEKTAATGSGAPGATRETIRISCIGRSQAVLRDIVTEAQILTKKTQIVPMRFWRGYWATINGKKPRSMDTIILAKGQQDRILADMRWFENSRDWYAKRGIPWRRGYLFSGPPGTGKTSLVLALAAVIDRPICILNLGSVGSDDALFSAVTDAPVDAIVLIEDIDCAQSSIKREPVVQAANDDDDDDEKEAPARERGVTKAGLLNALDGLSTPDGRIFIMTTNRPEVLDAALIRPGRADLHEHFGYLGPEDQVRMALLYYPAGAFTPLSEAVSPAAMQGAFMRHPDDAAAARQLLENPEKFEAAA